MVVETSSFCLKLARVLATISFVLLLLSFLAPWVIFDFPMIGRREFTILEFIASVQGVQADYGIVGEELGTLYLSLIFLIISVITAAISIFWDPVSLISGTAGLLSAALWVFEFDVVRAQIGAIRASKMNSVLRIGAGPFVVVIASVIMLTAFVLGISPRWSGTSSVEGSSSPVERPPELNSS
ncbi:MAG: hypothetical protein J7L91_05740 [Candidatus Korarchaeota archaeon]|nr:hypothetical protein [Candidatus Korarchaeota archaeon]